jgi:mono/diheme cytochrome c family protein
MVKTVSGFVLGGFVAVAAYSTAAAQAAKSVSEGVYTDEQAKKGEAIYKEQCASCHGDNLEGAGPMPALAGKDFLTQWQGKSVGDLFEKTHTSMPATAPGSLTPEQAAEITAFQLNKSGFPAGTAPLSTKLEELMQIKIEPAK